MEKPVALEHLDTPDENESQERALITKVAETLPSLERNVGQYMDLTAESPEVASKSLEWVLEVQLRRQRLPSVVTATEATERRIDEETEDYKAGQAHPHEVERARISAIPDSLLAALARRALIAACFAYIKSLISK
jgi:hypothetical protein